MEFESIFPEAIQPYSRLIVSAALALVIFIVGWIVAKWASYLVLKFLRKRDLDEAVARFLSKMLFYTVIAATLITALSMVGIEVTSLLALLGVAGLAVGLALRGNLSNFASGIMLLVLRPFVIGDRVRAAGHFGKIEEIGLFATTMRSFSNQTIIIPNAKLTSDSIVNDTSRDKLRGEISIGVAYGTDLNKAIEVLKGSAERCELVLADPAPKVVFQGFGASSLDCELRVWAGVDVLYAMLHDVRLAVYDDLNAAGIEIPFNQIVVHQAQAEEPNSMRQGAA